MNPCEVDYTTSPTFKAQLKPFTKKHPKLANDLAAAAKQIQKDYKNACDAARPPKRDLSVETWKYSIGSTDLKRSPRKAFRAIGVFLEHEEAAKIRTLYLTLFYWKGDQAEFEKKELEAAIGFLQGVIEKAKTAGAAGADSEF